MYNTPYEVMKAKIDTVFEENDLDLSDQLVAQFKKGISDFILHMKQRFINHYDVLVHSNRFKKIMGTDTCPNPVLVRGAFRSTENHHGIKLRRQISMESGVTSARAVKTAFRPDTKNEHSGLSFEEYQNVYEFLFQFFGFNYFTNSIEIIKLFFFSFKPYF